MKKVVLLICMMITLLILSGCKKDNELIGKWESVDSEDVMEFINSSEMIDCDFEREYKAKGSKLIFYIFGQEKSYEYKVNDYLLSMYEDDEEPYEYIKVDAIKHDKDIAKKLVGEWNYGEAHLEFSDNQLTTTNVFGKGVIDTGDYIVFDKYIRYEPASDREEFLYIMFTFDNDDLEVTFCDSYRMEKFSGNEEVDMVKLVKVIKEDEKIVVDEEIVVDEDKNKEGLQVNKEDSQVEEIEDRLEVPMVIGLSTDLAKELISEAGISVDSIEYVFDSAPKGSVISLMANERSVTAYSKIDKMTQLVINVSVGSIEYNDSFEFSEFIAFDMKDLQREWTGFPGPYYLLFDENSYDFGLYATEDAIFDQKWKAIIEVDLQKFIILENNNYIRLGMRFDGNLIYTGAHVNENIVFSPSEETPYEMLTAEYIKGTWQTATGSNGVVRSLSSVNSEKLGNLIEGEQYYIQDTYWDGEYIWCEMNLYDENGNEFKAYTAYLNFTY